MNYKSMARLTAVAVIFMQLLIACGGLSSKQKTAAGDALKALRKIEAATQVGVNYQQYGQLVIDAKAQVNEASSALPDGELKKELNATMEAYADAGQAWSTKVSSFPLKPDTEPGATLMRKYNLKTHSFKAGSTELVWLSEDDARQAAWGAAAAHLLAAQKLLDQ
ncbi:MAG: hypothetical protein AUG51_19025 [Acidobacteria bacterium 13_1_20CM_3_53_8]|nr:MAG: hypothetical protein AUG51_19025 [Acidobacteria bacterium 13_1_20CM_3_53_8]